MKAKVDSGSLLQEDSFIILNNKDLNKIIMKKSSKVLYTVLVVIAFLFVGTIIMGAINDSGGPSGIASLLIVVGLWGAIRAIWKQPEEGNENEDKKTDDNNSILQN